MTRTNIQRTARNGCHGSTLNVPAQTNGRETLLHFIAEQNGCFELKNESVSYASSHTLWWRRHCMEKSMEIHACLSVISVPFSFRKCDLRRCTGRM